MRIEIIMAVSRETNTETISLDDLNLSQAEWEHMTEEERKEAIQDWVNDMNDQPYWIAEGFNARY